MEGTAPRMLLFYRVVIGVLLLALAFAAIRTNQLVGEIVALSQPPPTAPPAPPPAASPALEVVDLAQRVQVIAREQATTSDFSETYFVSDHATVHMHMMAPEQTCPLHLHRQSEEVTVIAAGAAEVTQVFGQPSQKRVATHPVGEIVASPPFCGHQFVNHAKDQWLGNLVFASPRFDGNFYIAEDDVRMEKGTEPHTWRAAEALAQFVADGVAERTVPLPMMGGRMEVRLVADTITVDADRARPRVVYVLAGAGTIGAGKAAVHDRSLVVLESPTELRAAPGSPIAALVFDPERPTP